MKIHNWTNVSLEEFCSWFISADSLKKHFQKYELSRCLSAISTKIGASKHQIQHEMAEISNSRFSPLKLPEM